MYYTAELKTMLQRKIKILVLVKVGSFCMNLQDCNLELQMSSCTQIFSLQIHPVRVLS